jgi:hypothetical protein
MSIVKKLFLVLLAFILIPMSLVGYLTYTRARDDLKNDQLEQLKAIADLKAQTIENYFDGFKIDMLSAQDYWNIKKNLPILIRLAATPKHQDYLNACRVLDGQFKTFQKVQGLADFMLVDAEGRIVYVTNDSHKSIYLGKPLPDPGNRVFMNGRREIYLSDAFVNTAEENEPCMMLAAPARNEAGGFIGIIVFDINMRTVDRFIQDTIGLGKTGETVISKKTEDGAVFINELRHEKNTALIKKVLFNGKVALPSLDASRGLEGAGESIDYRGKRVIAVWRYLPALDWGLVAKMDFSEAYVVTDNLGKSTLVLFLITLVLGGFAAISLAQSVAKPVRLL